MIGRSEGVSVLEGIIQQVAAARQRAVEAAQQAEAERRRRREENDLYVSGGVHWNGFGLESLIKMVAERSSPAQLDALAGEWSRHGQSVVRASDDLRTSLSNLMQYWSGTSADVAQQKVTNNVAWISELGGTAQQMSAPIQDASGALRSAQDTMPGMPKSNWLGMAGGGAAAGFMVGGPIGAAFGAAIGGIASAFGFGNSKKKMKRKAVQTMERYEGALLGVDQATPQFGLPGDGVNPGDNPGNNPGPGIDIPRPGTYPPGLDGLLPGRPPTDWGGGITDPSFAGTPEGRWQSLTGITPGGGTGIGTGTGVGAGVGSGLGGFGAMPGMAGAGRGGGAGARPGGRGVGGFPGGMGAGGAGRGGDYKGRGRFNKAGGFGGMGAPGGRRDEEPDGEHRRRVPIEEDPFSAADLKAAPPVLGL